MGQFTNCFFFFYLMFMWSFVVSYRIHHPANLTGSQEFWDVGLHLCTQASPILIAIWVAACFAYCFLCFSQLCEQKCFGSADACRTLQKTPELQQSIKSSQNG